MTRTLMAFLLGLGAATAVFSVRSFMVAAPAPEPSARCEQPARPEATTEEDGRALDSKLDALEKEITAPPAPSELPAPALKRSKAAR